MVAPTCFGITLPFSGSVPSALWKMLNWGEVDRILWMGVLCLVAWCVAISRFSRIFLPGILIYKGLTARRFYKSFGLKGLMWQTNSHAAPFAHSCEFSLHFHWRPMPLGRNPALCRSTHTLHSDCKELRFNVPSGICTNLFACQIVCISRNVTYTCIYVSLCTLGLYTNTV
jgi:hypothetical protein